jgi:hypothetical protein
VFETNLQGTTSTEGTVHASKEKGEEKETLTGSEPQLLEPNDRSLSEATSLEGPFYCTGKKKKPKAQRKKLGESIFRVVVEAGSC